MEAPESHEVPTQCEKVGEPMPDIAGFGVLLGLSVQAFISLSLSFWVFFMTKLGRLDTQHPEGTPEHACEKKRLGFVSEILMVGNDLQMITGVALIITAISSAEEIDLYHLHLVFDTVSFVGISNAAALVCWTIMGAKSKKKKKQNKMMPAHWTGRFRVSYMFAVLFLVLTIFLLIRLDGWSLTSEELGRCYITTGISGPNAIHPTADKTYVAITAIWLLLVMAGTLFAPARFAKLLLILSSLQFPVHLYMMIKLRTENQAFLEVGENENHWDFGQTTAIILLVVAITELIHQGFQYLKFEKAVKKYGPEYALANEEEEEFVAGGHSIVGQGIKGLKDAHQNLSKRNLTDTRFDRGGDIEQQEESYELIRNAAGGQRTSL